MLAVLGLTSCRLCGSQLRQLIQSTSRGAKLWRDACTIFERLLHKQGPALGEQHSFQSLTSSLNPELDVSPNPTPNSNTLSPSPITLRLPLTGGKCA